jgi:hypothetical protein
VHSLEEPVLFRMDKKAHRTCARTRPGLKKRAQRRRFCADCAREIHFLLYNVGNKI